MASKKKPATKSKARAATKSKTKPVAKVAAKPKKTKAAAAARAPEPAASNGKKRDALELWELDGRLAEAMRSGGFKIGPAAYAAASMDTCLQNDGTRVRVVDGARVYSDRIGDYAILTLQSGALILQFVAPKTGDDLAGVEKHYRPVPKKPGWLEFRQPATRDPKPALAANLGSVLGQATFERSRR